MIYKRWATSRNPNSRCCSRRAVWISTTIRCWMRMSRTISSWGIRITIWRLGLIIWSIRSIRFLLIMRIRSRKLGRDMGRCRGIIICCWISIRNVGLVMLVGVARRWRNWGGRWKSWRRRTSSWGRNFKWLQRKTGSLLILTHLSMLRILLRSMPICRGLKVSRSFRSLSRQQITRKWLKARKKWVNCSNKIQS